jgi:hypothetical protein
MAVVDLKVYRERISARSLTIYFLVSGHDERHCSCVHSSNRKQSERIRSSLRPPVKLTAQLFAPWIRDDHASPRPPSIQTPALHASTSQIAVFDDV